MTKCKACGKSIIFLTTSSGRQMPVDVDGTQIMLKPGAIADPEDYIFFNSSKHISHFATCPKAKTFRKAKAA